MQKKSNESAVGGVAALGKGPIALDESVGGADSSGGDGGRFIDGILAAKTGSRRRRTIAALMAANPSSFQGSFAP